MSPLPLIELHQPFLWFVYDNDEYRRRDSIVVSWLVCQVEDYSRMVRDLRRCTYGILHKSTGPTKNPSKFPNSQYLLEEGSGRKRFLSVQTRVQTSGTHKCTSSDSSDKSSKNSSATAYLFRPGSLQGRPRTIFRGNTRGTYYFVFMLEVPRSSKQLAENTVEGKFFVRAVNQAKHARCQGCSN